MSEPKRMTKGEVVNISYRYAAPTKSGYRTNNVNVRKNRTMAETERQLARIRNANPEAYVNNEHNAYVVALKTFDALGLTGRGEKPANARIIGFNRRNNRR